MTLPQFSKLTFQFQAFKESNEGQGFALVGLRNPPVNALTKEVWEELSQMLSYCENSKEVRGLIFHSEAKRDIFSAGNDLMELYAPRTSKERFTTFWLAQTNFLSNLYRSPLITIACIKGYCPAGGCGISLCCDYRIMTTSESAPNSKIGLNEVAIGILVPKYWGKLYLLTVGVIGKNEVNLTFAKMLTSEQALSAGLIHEVVSKNNLLSQGISQMQEMLQIPDVGRQLTKDLVRGDFAKAWQAYGHEEARLAWDALSSPEILDSFGKVVNSMRKKSKI